MNSPCFPLAAALLAGITSLTAQQSSRYTLKGDSVAVYNLAGTLRLEAGTGGDVTVEVTRAGQDAAELKVETGPIRGRATLRVIYPDDDIVYPELGRGSSSTLRVRDDGTFGDARGRGRFREGRAVTISGGRGGGGGGGGGGGVEAHADLRLAIPAGKHVEAYLGVGRAAVSNVNGEIVVSVASADVVAEGMRGSLSIETGSGNIDVTNADGNESFETGSGDITVTTAKGPRIHLETGSGNIHVTGAEGDQVHLETGSGDVDVSSVRSSQLVVETGSGNVEVGLLSDVERMSVETGSGDVTLRVPQNLGAEVDIDTGSGEIDLGGVTVQVRRLQRDHISGTIGDGQGRLSIETGSGSVRLVKS